MGPQRVIESRILILLSGVGFAAVCFLLPSHPEAVTAISGAYGVLAVAFGTFRISRAAPDLRSFLRGIWLLVLLVVGLGVLDVIAGLLPPPLPDVLALGLGVSVATLGVVLTGRRQAMFSDRLVILQLVLEILLIASVTTIAAWRWAFAGLVIFMPSWSLASQLCVAVFIMSLGIVGAAREPVPSFLPIGLGAMMLGFSDTLVLYARAIDDPPILGKTLACLGYAVLVSGLPGSTTRDRSQFAERMEIRRVVTVGSLITGAGLLVLLSLTRHPEVDTLSQILLGIFLAAMLLRDGVQATRSGVMLSNLRVQALLDPLTRLPNRRALAELLPRFYPEAGHVSVLTVDLDEFKAVNDLLGHSIGDRLLQAVGDELGRIGQSWNAHVYRMGGDEFAIVCSCSPEQAETLAACVVEGVDAAAGLVPGVSRIGVGASVGVRHLPAADAASSVADGIVQSGHAMRAAKNAGKGRVHIFDDELQDAFRRRKLVELRLREQLGEVDLHFQPVVSAATGRVSAVEALARWHDPVLGRVEPEEFIEVAEYSGLIVDLGWRLLVRAVEQLATLSALDDRLVMAVNVSAMQLRMPGFAKDVLALLSDHDLATHRLLLEVTESVHVRADEPAGRAMAILSAAGVGMAIDDFGAGSTSVGYLAELPVSVIKIDRSLTAELPSPQATGIVRGVIEMSRGLGLRVVAEGIESLDQHELVRALGVTFTQGWLYSRAVPAERLLTTVDALERRFAQVHH